MNQNLRNKTRHIRKEDLTENQEDIYNRKRFVGYIEVIRINIKINMIYIFEELNDKMENFNRKLQTIKKSNKNSRNRNTIKKFFKLMDLRADWIQLKRDVINRCTHRSSKHNAEKTADIILYIQSSISFYLHEVQKQTKVIYSVRHPVWLNLGRIKEIMIRCWNEGGYFLLNMVILVYLF